MSQVMTTAEDRWKRHAVPWWAGWALAAAMLPVLVWLAVQYGELTQHRDRTVGFGINRLTVGLDQAEWRLGEAVMAAEAGDTAAVLFRLDLAIGPLQMALHGADVYALAMDHYPFDLFGAVNHYYIAVADLLWRVQEAGEVTAHDAELLRYVRDDVAQLRAVLTEDMLQRRDGGLVAERVREFMEASHADIDRVTWDAAGGQAHAPEMRSWDESDG